MLEGDAISSFLSILTWIKTYLAYSTTEYDVVNLTRDGDVEIPVLLPSTHPVHIFEPLARPLGVAITIEPRQLQGAG